LGRSILGAAESIKGFSRQDMRLYLDEFQTGPRLVAAATGKLNHDQLVDILAPRLGGLPAVGALGQRSQPTPQAGRRIAPYQCEQEHILLAMPSLPASHEKRIALAILNLILGGNMSSRLFQQVREARGLAYSVYSFLQSQEDCGMLGVYLAVPPRRCQEALRVVMDELALLASQPVSAQELRDAKKGLEGGVLLAAENMESRAGRLARDEFTFGREMLLPEIIASINAVDEDHLAQLAKSLLLPERMRFLALGPVEEEQWKFA
jgi:predicted Zn-dependent peptidase